MKIIENRASHPASMNNAAWLNVADMRQNAMVFIPTINRTKHEIVADVLASLTTPSTDASIRCDK
jgi:hypothetical protein